MGVSDITIIDTEALGIANQINLQWGVNDPNIGRLPYLQFDHAEVRYASDEVMTSPTVLTESASYIYSHDSVPNGAAYWYQVRAVDREGQAGEWCAAFYGEEAAIDSSAAAQAWHAFVPVLYESTASPLNEVDGYTLGVCRYKQVGLLFMLTLSFTVTDIGGASSFVIRGVPGRAQARVALSAYYEDGSSLVALSAYLEAVGVDDSEIRLSKTDGSAFLLEDKEVVISGLFEVAL